MNIHFPYVFVLTMVLSASVLEASVTVQELTTMATAKHPEYRGLRDAIVSQGESVLPELDRIYKDQSLDWRPRFAAGVCIEHIRRADDLHAFLSHDWLSEPGFRNAGPILATGYPRDCGPIVQRVEAEYGLWFYYIEVYAHKIFPEGDSKDYRILNMRSVLTNDSRGEERLFAARMAALKLDEFVQGNVLISDPIAWYADDLAAFVADGTFPEGKDILLANFPYMDSAVIKRVTASIQARRPEYRSTLTNFPGKKSMSLLESSETPTSVVIPVSEQPLELKEDISPQTFRKAVFAALLIVLSVIAFLLLSRRHRP